MSARTIRRICVVGVIDLTYRVLLRGLLRERIGVEVQ
jgi:hypothetical protein